MEQKRSNMNPGELTPDHELNLKVDDICVVLRSLERNGLATNSRVRILFISEHLIGVQIMTNPPRRASIRFQFKIFDDSSLKMTRIQCPLRLAYCMTYNKSQGQTLKKVRSTGYSTFSIRT